MGAILAAMGNGADGAKTPKSKDDNKRSSPGGKSRTAGPEPAQAPQLASQVRSAVVMATPAEPSPSNRQLAPVPDFSNELRSMNSNFEKLADNLQESQRVHNTQIASTLDLLKSMLEKQRPAAGHSQDGATASCSKATGATDDSLDGARLLLGPSDSTGERKKRRGAEIQHDVSDSEPELSESSNVVTKRARKDCSIALDGSQGLNIDAEVGHLLADSEGSDEEGQVAGDDHDLLDEFAQDLHFEDVVGETVQEPLATLLSNMLNKKMDEDTLNKKGELYPRPSNCPEIITPMVNPEIWSKIQKTTRSRDIRMQKVQASNVKGLGALAKLASSLLSAKSTKSPVSASESLKLCLDAFAFFANGNQELNNRRKEMIKPDLNARFKDLAKNNPVSSNLFGDDLSQQVKDINEADKMSKVMAKGSSRLNPAKGKQFNRSHQAKNWGASRRYNNTGGYNQSKFSTTNKNGGRKTPHNKSNYKSEQK